MKKAIFLLIGFVFCFQSSFAENNKIEDILRQLDEIVERRDVYFMQRQHRIDSLNNELKRSLKEGDLQRQYSLCSMLFDEYKSYQSDSAKIYAKKQCELSAAINSDSLKVDANCDMIFYYLSAGIFKDACDYVAATDLSKVSDNQRAEFYYQCIRLYSDMSNFSDGTFNDSYAHLSHAYSDSVINLLPQDNYYYIYATVFKEYSDASNLAKIAAFKKLLDRKDVSEGTKAMLCSIIADQYISAGNGEEALYYKALSAILDIKSAKRETTATRDLASMMYKRGDLERAGRYINAALEDANFFNARHRKMEINSILPLIEQTRYQSVNAQRTILWWVVGVISLLAVSLIVAIIYIIRQVKKLRAARKIIEDRNAEIESRNKVIEEHNEELKATNNKLRESNKIKDEYIGYGFYVNSEYIKKMEALYKLVNRKIATKQYEDLRMTLKDSDLRKEKESMHQEFDRIFLKLFPTFIEQFNSLFESDESMIPADSKSLTSEMRIFALIRLGISDNSNIASFLNYSVNTVNTYKTKTKNKSIVPNEQFEQKIMEIKSIS